MKDILLKEVINLLRDFSKESEFFTKDINGFKNWISIELEKDYKLNKDNLSSAERLSYLYFSEREFYVLIILKMSNKIVYESLIDYEISIKELIEKNYIKKVNNELLLTTKGNNYLYKDLQFIFNFD